VSLSQYRSPLPVQAGRILSGAVLVPLTTSNAGPRNSQWHSEGRNGTSCQSGVGSFQPYKTSL
jgi:hypothetical protein